MHSTHAVGAALSWLQEYIYSFKYGEDGVQFGLKATNGNQDTGTYNSKGKVGQWLMGLQVPKYRLSVLLHGCLLHCRLARAWRPVTSAAQTSMCWRAVDLCTASLGLTHVC